MHQAANMNDARISTMFDRPRLLNRKWWIMPEELHAALPDVSISRFPSILFVPRTVRGEIVKRFSPVVFGCRHPWKRNRNLRPALSLLANRCHRCGFSMLNRCIA